MGALLIAGWLLIQAVPSIAQTAAAKLAQSAPTQEGLPPLQAHPLPPTLAQWQPSSQDDYFSDIQAIEVGYLVWSRFPVKVYVQPVDQATNQPVNQYEHDRAQAWVAAVTQAVQDWTPYLPLAIVASPVGADIQVLRTVPPLQRPSPGAAGGASGSPLTLPRVRSAETRYELFLDRPAHAPARLTHRFTVKLSPNQPPAYTLATARHELGHAIGIWGHSPVATDVMYFAQVQSPPTISDRDVNTLKRIYEQPTQLEWELTRR
jgi:predicted Zn-dependent protease